MNRVLSQYRDVRQIEAVTDLVQVQELEPQHLFELVGLEQAQEQLPLLDGQHKYREIPKGD